MKRFLHSYAQAKPLLCVLFSLLLFTPTLKASLLADTLVIDAEDSDTLLNAAADSFLTDSSLAWPLNVQTHIANLIEDDLFEHSQLGLYVYDLTADSAIFEHGKRQLMRPASVQKLLTTVTALTDLGGSYQFTTRLFATGTIQDSILQGDLYLKGGFDPRFGNDDMQAFVDALAQKGIKQIQGNIYSDMSLKDTLKWGEGWCWDDEERTLRPLLYNGHDIFMQKFYEHLDDYGIAHPVSYSERIAPTDSIEMLIERSHTVDQILMNLLKNSDNLYAEALFYQLGARSGRQYPSARLSAERVENLIRTLGLNPHDYNIADGSGLSLYNYVTPQLIVSLLKYAWQRNNIYLHLFPALPVAGEDGTLSKRMRSGNAYCNVHAKTGTLRGVSTLAGYATAANGHLLCFCILNQGIVSNRAAHAFQDRICQAITQP